MYTLMYFPLEVMLQNKNAQTRRVVPPKTSRYQIMSTVMNAVHASIV